MQITSTTAMPASSSAWGQSTDQAQATAMTDLASALGIPVGESGEGQSQSSEESEFGGAMAMAEMLASSAKAAPKADPSLGLSPLGQKQSSKGSSGQTSEGPSAQATGKIDKNIPRGVGGGEEQGSLIQRMAVSSNTGAEIAGLKPWSKDWVMEGGLNRHPAQKTLVQGEARGGTADALTQLANLAQLMGTASTNQASESALNPETKMSRVKGAQAQMQARGQAQEQASTQATDMTMGQMIEAASSEAPRQGASRNPAPVKKALSGDDFLSLRQSVSETESSAQSAGKTLKVVPGGLAGGLAGGLQGQVTDRPQMEPALVSGPKERPSKAGLSTSIGNDTLGLIHPEMNGKAAALGASALPFEAAMGSVKLDGSVVPGSMQRNRLSSESVLGVSQNIRNLSANGGGEIRIRLKPDHLGEIHLRVSSSGKAGNEIGLQIQASDERAKKILEESISSLKDSLSGQNLNLSKVEVQVSQALSASNGSSAGQFDSQSNPQNPFNQDLGASMDQSGGRQFDRGAERGESGRPEGLRSSASKAFASGQSRTSSRASNEAGRIDVMA